jgi:hypothetical protein
MSTVILGVGDRAPDDGAGGEARYPRCDSGASAVATITIIITTPTIAASTTTPTEAAAAKSPMGAAMMPPAMDVNPVAGRSRRCHGKRK